MLFMSLTAPGDGAHFLPSGLRCTCTPDGGVEIAGFNVSASRRFNRWIQEMRRRFGPIEYAKAAEIQDGKRRSDGKGRGAVHFHILMRADDEKAISDAFRKGDPNCPVRTIAERHGFGHEIDLATATPDSAWYLAKYVSKSAAERALMPWIDFETGEIVEGNGRFRTWTASRGWGASMKSVRAAQAEWARENRGAAEGGALDSNTESYTAVVGLPQ
jgi:hypothetical protein